MNGVSKALTKTAPSGAAETDASQTMRLGNYAGGTTRTFDGVIDEIRASKTLRPATWILTEYRNQANPALFHYPMVEESQLA